MKKQIKFDPSIFGTHFKTFLYYSRLTFFCRSLVILTLRVVKSFANSNFIIYEIKISVNVSNILEWSLLIELEHCFGLETIHTKEDRIFTVNIIPQISINEIIIIVKFCLGFIYLFMYLFKS